MVVDLFKTDRQPDPLIGRTLDGRYEVLARLGEGGVGVVYRGRQAKLGRDVAIKVLHREAAAVPEWRRRFEREARALSALAHPNVVPVTDSGIDKGVPFLVMELLQGKTLGDLIKEGPLPLGRALDIARQTLRGLAFAHGKAIVHRDLKPTNVFLQALPDQADHVRLLDFGMAKFLDGSSSRNPSENLTRVGAVVGTAAYMSPEQIKAAPVDARSDVYAAGILLFELLAGRRPFIADSHEGYMGAHLTQPVPSLEKVRPGIAGAALLQRLVERAMAKKPAARFKDAAAMLAELETVVAKLPAGATSFSPPARQKKPTPPARKAAPSGSRFWRRAIILAVFGVGIGAVATVLRREGATPVETATLPAKPAPRATLPPLRPKATVPPPPPKAALPSQPPPAPEPAVPAEPTTTTPPPSSPSSPSESQPPEEKARQPEQPEQPTQPKQPEQAQPENERPAVAGARDPWKAPPPRALRTIRDRLDRGVHLSQRALRPAYEFARQNPDDPRPWLLLGHAYAQVDWFSDSVERYLRAHRVDSTCRGDPQMLADLLKAAAHPAAGRAAARAIVDIYGADAIPALEEAMKSRASDRNASARLARLRESLPR